MAYKLYWISGSPNSWRIQLALEYKGLEYKSERIDPSIWDREGEGFYKLNPRGKIPVLVDGDDAIYESQAILAYLEAKHPERSLLGNNNLELGKVWQAIAEMALYSTDPCFDFSRSVFMGTILDDIALGNERTKKINEELIIWEKRLEGRDFIAIETLSMADFYFYPTLAFLLRNSKHENAKKVELPFIPFDSKFPNLLKWMKRIETLDCYDATYPPHWK